MAKHTSKQSIDIEDTDIGKFMQQEKLALEIKQLKQSYFKKTIFPVLVQAGIGLTVAIITIFLAYKSNLFDVREKNIDAKTKYDETLLKTIELNKRYESLDKEVSDFEIRKDKLLSDSTMLSHQLDSMSKGYISMLNEKSILTNNITSLNKNKIILASELKFSTINKNLQDLKLFPSSYYKVATDLIFVLKSNNLHRTRVIDSLLAYTLGEKDSDLKCVSFYVLYMGTLNLYYKDKLFYEINNVIRGSSKTQSCLGDNFYYTVSNFSWNNQERMQLIKILLDNYGPTLAYCAKVEILEIISAFGRDENFSLYSNSPSLYWDYLKLNRELFLSSDTTLYDDDRCSALINISTFSPQLFFSLMISTLKANSSIDIGNSSIGRAFVKAVFKLDELPEKLYKLVFDFREKNNLSSDESVNVQSYYLKYYKERKASIDIWLFGNFEKFRNDTNFYDRVVKNKSF